MTRLRAAAILLLAVLLTILLAACNDRSESPRDGGDTPAPVEATLPAVETTEAIYPGPVVEPTIDALPMSDLAPYPAEMQIWIISPAGFQCEEALRYEGLAEARTALEEEGISVGAIEETNLTVCEACGCPTSRHFRAQITYSGLATSAELGWLQEP